MEPTVNAAIDAVRDGMFKGEEYGSYSYMGQGGSALSNLDVSLIGADTVNLVRQKQADIMAGKLKVEIDDNEPKPSP
jgi:hypothetical protein